MNASRQMRILYYLENYKTPNYKIQVRVLVLGKEILASSFLSLNCLSSTDLSIVAVIKGTGELRGMIWRQKRQSKHYRTKGWRILID